MGRRGFGMPRRALCGVRKAASGPEPDSIMAPSNSGCQSTPRVPLELLGISDGGRGHLVAGVGHSLGKSPRPIWSASRDTVLTAADGRKEEVGTPEPGTRQRGRDLAIGGGLLRQRGVGRQTGSRAPAVSATHTYELRRTADGWLLLVDETPVQRCNTLPEANLALIAARTAQAAGHPTRVARASRS